MGTGQRTPQLDGAAAAATDGIGFASAFFLCTFRGNPSLMVLLLLQMGLDLLVLLLCVWVRGNPSLMVLLLQTGMTVLVPCVQLILSVELV